MQVDKQDNVKKVIQKIIHDMRTPLIAVRSGASGLDGFLPALLKAYEVANRAGLVTEVIQPRHLSILSVTLKNIEQSANEINIKLNELDSFVKNGVVT